MYYHVAAIRGAHIPVVLGGLVELPETARLRLHSAQATGVRPLEYFSLCAPLRNRHPV